MSNKTKSKPVMEEVHTGYLNKSPPAICKGIITQKSWKRRFFVLSKTDENNYQLAYYRNNESKDKPLGKIDLSKISLSTSPETHSTWTWIHKHFKCAPSSVLFLSAETRDYFLIGQNSKDVDAWHNALVKVLQNSQNKLQNTDSESPKDNRIRSISAPQKYWEPEPEERPDERESVATLTSLSSESYYACPRTLSKDPVPAPRKSIEEKKDDEEEATEYMCMASVQMALEDEQEEVYAACTQTNVSDCKQIQDSSLFYKGDQIQTLNELLTNTLEEIQTQLNTLSKDEVTLTI